MERLMTQLTLFVMGMLLTTAAAADAVEDVKATYLQHIANTNSGNVDGFVEQHLPGHSAFGPTGAMLSRYDSIEEEKKGVRVAFEAARKLNPDRISVRPFANVQVKHLEVKVYGNLTAVATGYLVGTITAPDGTTRQDTQRFTSIWVRQGEQWKEVHDHLSALRVASGPQ